MNEIMICAIVTSLNLFNADIVCKHEKEILEQSKENKIDPLLYTALLWTESRFTPDAVSKSKACGISQVLPKYTDPKVKCDDLKNPKVGIKYGAKALSFWYYSYAKRNKKIAICAYNMGYRCKGEGGVKPEDTTGYVYAKHVMKVYRRFAREKRKLNKLKEKSKK